MNGSKKQKTAIDAKIITDTINNNKFRNINIMCLRMNLQDYLVLMTIVLLVAYDLITYFYYEKLPKHEGDTKKYPQNNLKNYLPITSLGNHKTRLEVRRKQKYAHSIGTTSGRFVINKSME